MMEFSRLCVPGVRCTRSSHLFQVPLLKAYACGNQAAAREIADAVVAAKGKRNSCSKILADQLERPMMGPAILAHPRSHLVLLIRRSLESYVSLQTAGRSNEWVEKQATDRPILYRTFCPLARRPARMVSAFPRLGRPLTSSPPLS